MVACFDGFSPVKTLLDLRRQLGKRNLISLYIGSTPTHICQHLASNKGQFRILGSECGRQSLCNPIDSFTFLELVQWSLEQNCVSEMLKPCFPIDPTILLFIHRKLSCDACSVRASSSCKKIQPSFRHVHIVLMPVRNRELVSSNAEMCVRCKIPDNVWRSDARVYMPIEISLISPSGWETEHLLPFF
jgi:hypothetical protein